MAVIAGALEVTPGMVLDSINEGVYVTDKDRTIVYWGKSAERITGWRASDVVGKKCRDRVLCHIDKDGHRLCGEEHCPLHRCITTGQRNAVPVIVFAQNSTGGRVPLQVAVAPLFDESGEIIGGVETFRDITHEMGDIDRASKIQQLLLPQDLPSDPRVRFTYRYVPKDVIGGDYCAVAPLTPDDYGIFIADVSGHGLAAALYTMLLSSLWRSHRDLLLKPAQFAHAIGECLHELIQQSHSFAAATCGVLSLKDSQLRLAGSGNPAPLIRRANGAWEQPDAPGLPLGLMSGAQYGEVTVPLYSGDSILFLTDGALEITATDDKEIGSEGLVRILDELNYPSGEFSFAELETKLLASSNRIRFDDDMTFLEVQVR